MLHAHCVHGTQLTAWVFFAQVARGQPKLIMNQMSAVIAAPQSQAHKPRRPGRVCGDDLRNDFHTMHTERHDTDRGISAATVLMLMRCSGREWSVRRRRRSNARSRRRIESKIMHLTSACRRGCNCAHTRRDVCCCRRRNLCVFGGVGVCVRRGGGIARNAHAARDACEFEIN